MNLNEVLDEANILPALDVENKDQALKEISRLLYQNEYINDVDQFLKDIYKREELGETGIGNYIAIPHGQSDSVLNTTISIAKLKNEIEWETLDGKGVKVVILFAVKNDTEHSKNHLKLLAEVAKRLAKDNVRESLLEATTEKEIIEAFNIEQ